MVTDISYYCTDTVSGELIGYNFSSLVLVAVVAMCVAMCVMVKIFFLEVV